MHGENFRARQARRHSTYEKTIEIILKNTRKTPRDADEALIEAETRSDAYALSERFLELAKSHCIANEYPPGSESALHVFENANKIADWIIHAAPLSPLNRDQVGARSESEVVDRLSLRIPPNVNSLVGYVRLMSRCP